VAKPRDRRRFRLALAATALTVAVAAAIMIFNDSSVGGLVDGQTSPGVAPTVPLSPSPAEDIAAFPELSADVFSAGVPCGVTVSFDEMYLHE
jgi:hypothetical protein